MKRILSFFFLTAITVFGVFGNSAKAKIFPTEKQILVIVCYDDQGQSSGIGNTCQSGSGNCIANPCTD